MTTINLNEEYRITYDGISYVPEYFKKGGELLTKGMAKGHVTKDKWVSMEKFCPTLERASQYCVNRELSAMGSVDMDAFLREHERITNEFIEGMRGNNGA